MILANSQSSNLVSCRNKIVGSSIVIKPSTCFNRCRSELTFQVMMVRDVDLAVLGVDAPLSSKCRDLDVESQTRPPISCMMSQMFCWLPTY